MSSKTNEEIARHMLARVGVLAVRDEPEAPIGAVMHIFAMFQYKEPLRIVAGDTGIAISCFCESGIAVAIIVPSGHRVQKSLRRMTLRTIRSGRTRPHANVEANASKTGDAA